MSKTHVFTIRLTQADDAKALFELLFGMNVQYQYSSEGHEPETHEEDRTVTKNARKRKKTSVANLSGRRAVVACLDVLQNYEPHELTADAVGSHPRYDQYHLAHKTASPTLGELTRLGILAKNGMAYRINDPEKVTQILASAKHAP